MKKHIKMSEKVILLGLGLFWSSKEVKMTKCCLVCIRAQANLEEAWVLWVLDLFSGATTAENYPTKKFRKRNVGRSDISLKIT